MKSDAIIVGAELDGLVAAMRLVENGYSVRLFSNGASSLHYAPGGIHVLARIASGEVSIDPFDAIAELDASHPYRKIGIDQLKQAFRWYTDAVAKMRQPVEAGNANQDAVSAAGLRIPVYAISEHQATFEKLAGKRAAIVCFDGHRDSPTELLMDGLAERGVTASRVEVECPGTVPENAAIARTFDTMESLDSYFTTVRGQIPASTDIIVFPAVMGLHNFQHVLATARRVIRIPCVEVPTLPPSLPGMRLEFALRDHLKNTGVIFHTGAFPIAHSVDEDGCNSLFDNRGRCYQAATVIVSSGGVLMGGLDVDSHGLIHETALGLDVFQTCPLEAGGVVESLDALHTTGIETDSALRPQSGGLGRFRNVFVTGRTLAHWNPAQEGSSEGVCIATGWVAAESARSYLETKNAA